MKKIIDNITFVNKKPLELEYKYEYNEYKENEFTQRDNLISYLPSNNDKEQSSYITLTIEKNTSFTSPRALEENSHIFIEKINELSSYENLPVSLDRLFNTIDSFNFNKSFLTLDNSFKNLLNYYEVFKTDEEIKSIDFSKRLCIDKNFLENYSISNKKSSFYSQKDDDVFEKNTQIHSQDLNFIDHDVELNSGKFLNNYEVYNKRLSSEINNVIDIQNHTNSLEQFVGFYIVKYKKQDSGSNYEKIATRFIKAQGNQIDSIKDFYVKYSMTYRYYIYPVFSLTMQSFNNNFYYDQALICGYPLITEDIEAIESVRPNYPAGPFVRILKDRLHLEINWEKPLERQNDIKGFQVFKRHNLDEPYTLIQEIRGHLSGDVFSKNEIVLDEVLDITPGEIKYRFTDREFDTSKVNIYTVCSIDAHGLTSKCSTQIGVVYDLLQDKLIIDTVSEAGAPIEYPNLLVPRKTRYYDNEDSIISNVPLSSRKDKFTFYFTPDSCKVLSEYIDDTTNEKNVIHENSKFSLSIFRVNGQKSILIEDENITIQINNFNKNN